MAIVIKKKVSLDFLGEEYAKAYLVFKAVPVSEYGELLTKLDTTDRAETVKVMVALLKKKFIEGKFPGDDGELADLTADDIEQLDEASLAECFAYATGQRMPPKP